MQTGKEVLHVLFIKPAVLSIGFCTVCNLPALAPIYKKRCRVKEKGFFLGVGPGQDWFGGPNRRRGGVTFCFLLEIFDWPNGGPKAEMI